VTVRTLLAELDRGDIQVWADGDRLQCNAPAGVLTPELRDQLRQHKGEILEFLRGPAELSYSQQRLWFLDQMDPGGSAYVISQALEMRGALDALALERTLEALVRRHDALRTVFVNVEGRPRQVVSEPRPWTLPLVDLRGEPDGRERLAQLLREEAAQGFDLAQGPLFRARLYRLAPDTHVLLLAMHHIISDGWSIDVLVRELGELYGSLYRGEESTLPALRLQYRDFARWERGRLQGEALEVLLSHWRTRLAGAPQVLELPTDRPRPPVESHCGASYSLTLPLELADRLRGLARRDGATLFMTLVAGFTLLLARYSGQQDILLGTPVANRSRTEFEPLVGCFVNTLVLRADLTGNPTVSEFLARMREVCLDAFTHQDLPFDRLVEEMRPERDLSRSPLLQAMFVLRNAPQRPLELPGLTLRPVDVDRGAAHVDLTLRVQETAEGFSALFEYASDLFEEPTIARMAAHWRSLLEAMTASPERRVGDLPLLSEAERRQLLEEWNQTAVEYPRNSCLYELIEMQAARTPQTIAVSFEDQHLSYRELNRRSNQLAHHLRNLGVGPDVLVGICVERSLEMVVGLLGILKAGGAYVPIDPTYPAERVAFMLQDSQAPVLLTRAHLLPRLPSHSASTVCLDTEWHKIAHLPTSAPPVSTRATHLAYVIYTSGSTGTPKGACITHRGLVNYLSWAINAYKVAEGAGAPVHSSIAFDLTVTSLFGPLLVGRTVHLLPDEQGIESLAGALRAATGYSLVKLTPAHLQLLQLQIPPDQVADRTRTFVIGGEQLRAETAAFWRQHAERTVLVNEYGPTETVVGCCVYTVTPATRSDGAIPIGRPIANTRLYVLDQYMAPVPIGVVGELYIGGDGVARGYWNRPVLTAERFVPDPFSGAPNDRLYRTGDLARYLPDGNIEFLGRRDNQVKIRGFRVELGEIEAVLGELAQVREAVVVLCEDEPGDQRLVAYVVPRDRQVATPDELRSALKQRLPDYMLPSAFVIMEQLPLTHNGKVDRGALPAPEAERQLKDMYVPPRTEWELKLARIWQESLRVERVGVDDNFFDLGGHSLMIVRLISEINQRYQVSLGVEELFRNPTVRQMAGLIDGQQPKSKRQPAVIPLQKGQAERLPVYFIYAGPDEIRLAQLMGERHAVFGIEVPWPLAWRNAVAANRRSGFPTMEQLVAPYVAALRAHTRASPCVLAGYSFAGLMAFEAAHQFQRQGGKVEMVMLLDTWARSPIPHQVAWHKWRQDWKQASNGLSTDRLAGWIGARLRNSWRITRWLLGQEKLRVGSSLNRLRLNPNELVHILDEEGMPLAGGMLDRVYTRIGESYRPRRLDSWGVLFRTDQINGKAVLRDDDSQGWDTLFTRGLEIIPMIGDHLSMIRSHHPTLAREMNKVLTRYWSSEPDEVSIDALESRRQSPAPETRAIASLDHPDRRAERRRGRKSL
jgi:amino acid adenylation domain-containing protein